MLVEVRLFATLRNGRFKKRNMELSEGSVLDAVLERLKIAREEVGILLVNGRDASEKGKLAPNDVVSIFPSLGGG
ncbi:MAG: MoaD/ThiS family protein [Planctomycetota bacterium]|jgi:sulfur carrier protein